VNITERRSRSPRMGGVPVGIGDVLGGHLMALDVAVCGDPGSDRRTRACSSTAWRYITIPTACPMI
jgi:hypothetical protein